MTITNGSKKIIIQSFGFRFPDKVPQAPAHDSGIIFRIEDVRIVTPDPWPQFRLPALDPDTYQEIITRPEVASFLETETTYLYKQIQRMMGNNGFHTFQNNYGCMGGYQRSVAIAIWAHDLITRCGWTKKNNLTIEHLTLDLCKTLG